MNDEIHPSREPIPMDAEEPSCVDGPSSMSDDASASGSADPQAPERVAVLVYVTHSAHHGIAGLSREDVQFVIHPTESSLGVLHVSWLAPVLDELDDENLSFAVSSRARATTRDRLLGQRRGWRVMAGNEGLVPDPGQPDALEPIGGLASFIVAARRHFEAIPAHSRPSHYILVTVGDVLDDEEEFDLPSSAAQYRSEHGARFGPRLAPIEGAPDGFEGYRSDTSQQAGTDVKADKLRSDTSQQAGTDVKADKLRSDTSQQAGTDVKADKLRSDTSQQAGTDVKADKLRSGTSQQAGTDVKADKLRSGTSQQAGTDVKADKLRSDTSQQAGTDVKADKLRSAANLGLLRKTLGPENAELLDAVVGIPEPDMSFDRVYGREPESRAFARAHRIANELATAHASLGLPPGQPVVDLLAMDEPLLSRLEVAFELAPYTRSLLAVPVAPPFAGWPLLFIIDWLNSGGRLDEVGTLAPRSRESFEAALATCRDGIGRVLHDEDMANVGSIVQAMIAPLLPLVEQALEHGYDPLVVETEDVRALVSAIDDLGGQLARLIEGSMPAQRRRYFLQLIGDLDDLITTQRADTLARAVLEAHDTGQDWTPSIDLVESAERVVEQVSLFQRRGTGRDVGAEVRATVTSYVPADAYTKFPPKLLDFKILREGETTRPSGWVRLLGELRAVSMPVPTTQQQRAHADVHERMFHDSTIFWSHYNKRDVQVRKGTRASGDRGLAPWSMLIYLPGDFVAQFAHRAADNYHAVERLLGDGLMQKLQRGDPYPHTLAADPRSHSSADEVLEEEEDLEPLHDAPEHLQLAVQLDLPDAGIEWHPGHSIRGARRLSGGRRVTPRFEPLSSTDSGDPKTLSDFIVWGSERCPSRRLALVVKRHWVKIELFTLCDDHSQQSHLTLREFVAAIREALDRIGREKLDLLVLDMDDMLTLECAYELRTIAHTLVAKTSQGPGGIRKKLDYGATAWAFDERFDPRGEWMEMTLSKAEKGRRPLAYKRERLDRLLREGAAELLCEPAPDDPASQRFERCDLGAVDELSRHLDLVCRLLFGNLHDAEIWSTLERLLQVPQQYYWATESRRSYQIRLADFAEGLTALAGKGKVHDRIAAAARQVLGAVNGPRMARGLTIGCPAAAEVIHYEGYLELGFHQKVHLSALLTAVRLLQSRRPHQLWGMISTAITHATGDARRALLEQLTGDYGGAASKSGKKPGSRLQLASLAPPPLITLSLEHHRPLDGPVDPGDSDGTPYRVRLASTESTATLPQNICHVNHESIEEALVGFEALLSRARGTQAHWHYLEALGDGLGEDIIHRLRDNLLGLREEVMADSPGSDDGKHVHLALRLPRELMRYPWELMGDGDGSLADRYAVGRQVWTDDGWARAVSHRSNEPLRVLVVGDPQLMPGKNPPKQLLGAREEAELVVTLFERLAAELGPAMDFRRDRDAFLGTTVTCSAMRRLLRERSYDIVHFSGHGSFDTARPERSGWRLSDGRLTARDLSNTLAWAKSPPWLIYANACESGMTHDGVPRYYSGDVFGMATACINEGVANYIAPLWRVDDDTAQIMAQSFYESLVFQRATLGSALQRARHKAKQAAMSRPMEYGQHDISWASMVLYGDPGDRWQDTVGG